MPDDPRHEAVRHRDAAQAKAAAPAKARGAARPAAARPEAHIDLRGEATGTPQVRGAARPAMSLGHASATAGSTGILHITFEKFWMPVGNDLPCGFLVSTLPENGLEVTLEQRAYRKTHAGTGSVRTGLCPVAPIGTTGRMLARDLATGETVEVPWTWHLVGGGGFWAGLLGAIKRALWKG